jgi:hypothetical protein
MPFTLQNQLQPDILKEIQKSGSQLWFKEEVRKFYNQPNGLEELRNAFSSICTGIHPGYIEEKIKMAMNTDKYDILMIVSSKNILYGFMITEENGCPVPEYKNVPVLSLVCTSQVAKQASLSPARIMMYTYVTALKNHTIDFGILELADAYNNIGGYCLYKKFGFDEHMALRQCFKESESLPMMVYVPGISYEQLDDVLLHNIQFRIIDVLCNQTAKTDKIHSKNVRLEKQAALKLVETNMRTYNPPELHALQNKLKKHLSSISTRFSAERHSDKLPIYDVNGLNNMFPHKESTTSSLSLSMSPLKSKSKSNSKFRSKFRSRSPRRSKSKSKSNFRSKSKFRSNFPLWSGSRSGSRSSSLSSSTSRSPRRFQLTRRKKK